MSGKQSADEQIKWWWNGITYQMSLRSNDQTRLEKDGMDVENTSVTGSSKQHTILDMSLMKKKLLDCIRRKMTIATKTVLELPCVVLQNELSHLPRLSSLGYNVTLFELFVGLRSLRLTCIT